MLVFVGASLLLAKTDAKGQVGVQTPAWNDPASPEIADAIARAIIRDAYWRDQWGGEQAARQRFLGRPLSVVISPAWTWRGYCVADLQSMVFIDSSGSAPIAEIEFRGKDFRGCAQRYGDIPAVLALPVDVASAEVDPKRVARGVATMERRLLSKKGHKLSVYVSTHHTFDARVAYTVLGLDDEEPVLLMFDELGEVKWAIPVAEPAARNTDIRKVAAKLLKHGTRVKLQP